MFPVIRHPRPARHWAVLLTSSTSWSYSSSPFHRGRNWGSGKFHSETTIHRKKGDLRISLPSVQSLSCIWLFVTPWTIRCQASLSITDSQSLLKLVFSESMMPSSYLILCPPLLLLPSFFPASGSFQMSQFLTSGGQSNGASASVSVLPMNIQDWFPLRLTSLTGFNFNG